MKTFTPLKTLSSLFAYFSVLITASAQDYTYTNVGNAVVITKYLGPGGEVNIPAMIDGLPVVGIGAHAFSGGIGITSIEVPAGVTNIGYGAFEQCTNLTSVVLPETVLTIDMFAFENCNNLPNVNLPNGLERIENGLFKDCWSLKSISIPETVKRINGFAFESCYSLKTVRIPNNVTTIDPKAFHWCRSLEQVVIPNSVTAIGWWAFNSCYSLTNITIPPGVTTIENATFFECTNLTGAYFEGDAPSAGADVFVGSDHAVVYYLPETQGWGTTFAGRPTMIWQPRIDALDDSFGIQNNQFGFPITWASGKVVVVEASSDALAEVWTPVGTNTLVQGTAYFSDPDWGNYPNRIYRLNAQ